MTLGDIEKRVLIKLEEYSATAVNLTTDADIAQKLPFAIDEAIKFAFLNKSEKRTWEIVQGEDLNRIKNQQLIYTHKDEDIVFSVDKGYGYYFEVDDEATIVISQGGVALVSVSHPAQTGARVMTAFKGFTGAAAGEVTITFSGTKQYNFQNIALYGALYSALDRIPAYSYWTKHTKPANHHQIHDVRSVNGGAIHKVVDDQLWLRTEDAGEFIVTSSYFPDAIDDTTAKSTEVAVPLENISIIVNKAAALITQRPSSTDDYLAEADQGMTNMDNRETKGMAEVVDLPMDD